jgi:hypothetical protein
VTGPRQKPPTEPPPSAGVLARYARAYAKDLGVSEGRVRAWISYMVLAGLLEQSRESSDGFQFTVKGGVALELRLKDRARATKDIDLVLHHAEVDLGRALERAIDVSVRGGYQGFNFRRKGEPLVLENRTISVELAVTYEGGTWTSIIVDVARAEAGEGEIELLPAIPLQATTGITGPIELACLSLRMHVAQKIHGMTLPPRRGKRTSDSRTWSTSCCWSRSSSTTRDFERRVNPCFELAVPTIGRRCSNCRLIGRSLSRRLLGTSIFPCMMATTRWSASERSLRESGWPDRSSHSKLMWFSSAHINVRRHFVTVTGR